MASFHTYTPPPPLSAFVERFWLSERDDQPYPRELALPTGKPALWIDLGGDGLRATAQREPDRMRMYRTSVLLGPHSRSFLVEAGRHVSRIGVQFKPGGASAFVSPPAGELRGLHVPLDALWGDAAAGELHERLLAATTPDARFRVLACTLLARRTHTCTKHPAVAYALDALRAVPQPRTIAQVVEQTGVSHRQFISVFRRDVGMSPKTFCSLRRFLAVVGRAGEADQLNWAAVALDCGYYDQSHLAHDFRTFAGVTPTVYLRDRDARIPTYLPYAEDTRHALPAALQRASA